MPRTLPLALIAATLTLGLNSAGAAPKHDKHDKHGGGGDDVTVDLRGPSIDIGRVRIVLGDNRELIGPAQSLPPGIRKNLARGKPLPPGIAKKMVPGPMLRDLPVYAGHEWRVAGDDLILVSLGSGLVVEVMGDIFR